MRRAVALCIGMPRRLFLLALLAAGPAMAQGRAERPEPTPRMDVAVTYATTPLGAPPGEMRIAFHAASGTFRVDPQPQTSGDGAAPIYILSRRGQDRAVMVMESRQAFLELDPGANMLRDLEVALASGRARRQGQGRVANTPCTVWNLPEPDSGSACISARGVLLRRETPHGGVMEATVIDMREQDATRFRAPPQFRRITMQEMFASPE